MSGAAAAGLPAGYKYNTKGRLITFGATRQAATLAKLLTTADRLGVEVVLPEGGLKKPKTRSRGPKLSPEALKMARTAALAKARVARSETTARRNRTAATLAQAATGAAPPIIERVDTGRTVMRGGKTYKVYKVVRRPQ